MTPHPPIPALDPAPSDGVVALRRRTASHAPQLAGQGETAERAVVDAARDPGPHRDVLLFARSRP